jgi:hypothetical protein
MPIIRSGYNIRFKYEVSVKPWIGRMNITSRGNVSRTVFNELKDAGIIQKNFGFHVFTRYALNIPNLEMAAGMMGCLSTIINMGKIRVPSNLSYKNDVEAIVGSLCRGSRVLNARYDRDIDLIELN